MELASLGDDWRREAPKPSDAPETACEAKSRLQKLQEASLAHSEETDRA